MADVKISQLPVSVTPLTGTEVLPIVQSGATRQVSVSNLTAGRTISAANLTLSNPLTPANGGTGIASLGSGVASALGNPVNQPNGLCTQDVYGNLTLLPLSYLWGSSYRVFDSGYASFAAENATVGQTLVSNNAYNSGSAAAPAWKYKFASPAALYAQAQNIHSWYSTTAGASPNDPITWGNALMVLDSSANLTVGHDLTPNAKLDVRSGASAAAGYFSSTSTTAYNAAAFNGSAARLFLAGGNATNAFSGIEFSQGGNCESFFGAVQNASGLSEIIFQGYDGANYVERMRLDSSSRLGVATAPVSSFSVATLLPIRINTQNTDVTPGASWGGQITTSGAGYFGGISMNATGLYLGHNSTGRNIIFQVSTEVARFSTTGNFGLGTTTVNARLQVSGAASFASQGTSGVRLRLDAATITNTSTAGSGTVTTVYGDTFKAITFAATNASVTYTNSFGAYFESPVAGSNITLTNKWALGADSILAAGPINSNTADGIGYIAGAGGTVTQGAGSGKATAVTLNKACGQITMNNAALAANTTVSFTLTNSSIAATDVIIWNQQAGSAALGSYAITSSQAAGSAVVYVRNISAASLSEALVLSFAVVKAATA